jgi:hypothetical protein
LKLEGAAGYSRPRLFRGRRLRMELARGTAAALLSVVTLAVPARPDATPIIAAEDASKYVGKAVTIEGTVGKVSESGRGTTFVNFGAPYPNQVLSAVIYKSARSQFPADLSPWNGRRLRITGTVHLYQMKPEIVLDSPSQVQVLEAK